MIYLITSKDNQICYLSVLQNILTSPPTDRYWFQICSIINAIPGKDQETSTSKFLFNYHIFDNISDCIKMISDQITIRHAEMKERPEDKKEEEVIISACEKHLNSEVIQWLEAYTIATDLAIESIYSLFKIPDYNLIISMIKKSLNLTDIKELDLVSLTYAIYKVLNKGR